MIFHRICTSERLQKVVKYSIFKTKWGYFGLAGTEYGLLRSQLPGLEADKIKCRLLKNLQQAQFDKDFFKAIQQQIIAYFDGDCINFNEDVPVILDGVSLFARGVLITCRNIRFGETISYGRLAERIGRAGAGRAVGRVLAKNPLPLIIPCHRVIKSDGKIGGFSSTGGKDLKKRLLRHEQKQAPEAAGEKVNGKDSALQ
jgi:methylated-DNA-[protein]-cysteine S-methyltransferase